MRGDKPDANNSYEPGRKRKVGYTVEKHPAKKKKKKSKFCIIFVFIKSQHLV